MLWLVPLRLSASICASKHDFSTQPILHRICKLGFLICNRYAYTCIRQSYALARSYC